MTATEGERHRIVIVDDEEALVWSLSNRISKIRPSFAVETLTDGQVALRRLEEAPADLLITDIRMPGISGLELIMEARRLSPRLPVIVMTAFPTSAIHEEVARRGSIEYLEKPFEFERFLTAVDDALQRRRTGFSGAISVQTLPDIVQLYALSNTTGVLHVRRNQQHEGRIWFERGSITHAETDTSRGIDAFYEIMLWSGGEFSMQLGQVAKPSIRASWTELIMESCRRLDDSRRSVGEGMPASTVGWSFAPPASDDDNADVVDFHVPEHVSVDLFIDFKEPKVPEEKTMADIKESLRKLDSTDGFVGAALVDSESGMMLGSEGGGPVNLEIAAAANTEVVRAKRKAVRALNLKDDIEDILITLGKQYHLIRPMRSKPGVFFYVVLDRPRANLAMARMALAEVERDLQF